jgi:1-acyl-sn-glycerol-3-phosphate acyltransferase
MKFINNTLRWLFFASFVRVIILFVLGLNVRDREKLPQQGPAIIVANHNSHLDTMVLMTLLPLRILPIVKPVAAMDYFLRNKFLAWFALNIVGILPISRKAGAAKNPLAECSKALDNGNILIFFPEGSRGEPEKMQQFKSGIARLAQAHPDVPVCPVYLHGLGKALPKGESLIVPFFCDIFIGDPLSWQGDKTGYMHKLEQSFATLAEQGNFKEWM